MFRKFIEEFSSLETIEAIALGGSRATHKNDENSDYDVYVYCSKLPDKDLREKILTKYCGYMEIGNTFWETEDDCILKNGIPIDVIYRNLDEFSCSLSYVVEQCHSYNGYTTCMWNNLMECQILIDKSHRLQALKDRFDIPYPEQLKENIIKNNMDLLKNKLPNYRDQIEKSINRNDIISINHRTAAFMESYFDIIFALNKVTHPGEKRMIQFCLEKCKLLPNNFEKNIKNLYKNLFSDENHSIVILEEMIKELELMI